MTLSRATFAALSSHVSTFLDRKIHEEGAHLDLEEEEREFLEHETARFSRLAGPYKDGLNTVPEESPRVWQPHDLPSIDRNTLEQFPPPTMHSRTTSSESCDGATDFMEFLASSSQDKDLIMSDVTSTEGEGVSEEMDTDVATPVEFSADEGGQEVRKMKMAILNSSPNLGLDESRFTSREFRLITYRTCIAGADMYVVRGPKLHRDCC